MSAPVVAERGDIHRSCKALEGVVNVLNDYCEAAAAVVAIQKKLAKALREAASTRNVSEIAGNTLNASATIFEAVCDVDAKFAKLADKECDSISAEVKRWFKKLAKEERAHDERVANANYRIKQAGQMYERKVKKNPEDAAEEHSRYIGLLSSLGPEITQEKHNHAMAVTQRHADTLYSVAACLARVADAEWLRACEGVRRMSPCAGSVGEWRALCEGGWNGSVPPDVPDVDAQPEQKDQPPYQYQDVPPDKADNSSSRTEPSPNIPTTGVEYKASATLPAPGHTPTAVTPTDVRHSGGYFPAAANGENPAANARDFGLIDDDGRDRSHSVNSIASLGSFPAPPTHFPLPPVAAVKQHQGEASPVVDSGNVSNDSREMFSTPKSSIDAGREEPPPLQVQVQAQPQPQPSPQPQPQSQPQQQAQLEERRQETQHGDDTFLELNSPTSSPSNAPLSKGGSNMSTIEEQSQDGAPSAPLASQTSSERASEHTPVARATSPPSQSSRMPVSPRVVSGPRPSMSMFKKGDYIDEAEFGVRRPSDAQASPTASRSLDRSDTSQSNGSAGNASRERYTRSTAPASPPPTDVPRLPMSVSALASRYSVDSHSGTSPQLSPRTPTGPSMNTSVNGRTSTQDARLSPAQMGTYNLNDRAPSPLTEEISRRKQRLQELEELELREQEYELRLKEREIEQKARQLEQDRMRLLNARMLQTDGYESDGSHSHAHNNLRLPLVDSPASSPILQTRHPYASSSSSQLPTSAQIQVPRQVQRYSSQQSLVPAQPSPTTPQASRPLPTPSHEQQQAMAPTLTPLTLRADKAEKPKGWIRRLSMPVMGNAFSSDSKKGISSTTYTPNAGMRNSFVYPDDGQIDAKHRSSTNLGRR